MHSCVYALLSVYVCMFIIDTYHTQTLSAQDMPGSLNGDLASAHRWPRRCDHAFAHATSYSIIQLEQRSLGASMKLTPRSRLIDVNDDEFESRERGKFTRTYMIVSWQNQFAR